jgi:hypothetical protein
VSRLVAGQADEQALVLQGRQAITAPKTAENP